jgi:multicomponent Na+:H+ antiporter subunit D
VSALQPHLPALQVVVPMMSAPLAMLLRERQLSWMLATAASLCAFAIAIALTREVLAVGEVGYLMGSWPAPFLHC